MQISESKGLVLYQKKFREADLLVKIFTEKAGKRMFFVKHARTSRLTAILQPLTVADFILKLNDQGLSYIDDFKEVQSFQGIREDIFPFSYATYLAALTDAAIVDNSPDPNLFAFLVKTLELMEQGLDYEILTNIFELQLLSRFGVSLNVQECVFCHRQGLPFDFSFHYSGVLCPDHYHKDPKRSHLDPNVIFLLNRLQSVSFEELQTIRVSGQMKEKLRQVIDAIYEDYVGIHLKSKSFIDGLSSWGDILKSDPS